MKDIKLTFIHKLFVFILYPFGGFLLSLIDFRSKSSHYIFFLYFVLFGFAFTPKEKGLDSYRYIERFNYTSHTAKNIENYVETYFKFESEKTKDIYLMLSYYIISRYTKNYHFLFALYAIVFAFFYLLTFRFITINRNFKYALPFYVLSILFALSNPIFNINGVRFWTASWIGVYAMFQLFINNNKKYILLSLITPLIHGAFTVYLFLILIIFLTRKFEKFWIVVFTLSLFFSATSLLSIVDELSNSLPPFLQKYLYVYAQSKSALEKMEGNKNLVIRIFEFLPNLFVGISILFFVRNKTSIKQDKVSQVFFQIILVWFSFVFFTMGIPSLGGRYFLVGIPFLVYLWINSYPVMEKYNAWLIFGFPIAFIYPVWSWIIKMSLVTEPYFYYSLSVDIIWKNLSL